MTQYNPEDIQIGNIAWIKGTRQKVTVEEIKDIMGEGIKAICLITQKDGTIKRDKFPLSVLTKERPPQQRPFA